MTGFDQLGLFSTTKLEKTTSSLLSKPSRLSLTIDFSSNCDQKINDVLNRIKKDISQLDRDANVTAKIDHDERLWLDQEFFAIDVETTGLDAASNRIIELAIIPFNMSDDVKPFCKLFSVGEPLPQEIVSITGISDDMLKNQPAFSEHADECLRLLKRAQFVVAYNAKFDRPFLESEMARIGKVLPDIPWIDPFVFICEIDRYKRGKKLSDAAKRWGVNLLNAHRAMADAQAAGELMLKIAEKVDCRTIDELLTKQKILQWQNTHNMAELKRSSSWSTNR